MKKHLFAALAAVASLGFAASADAANYCAQSGGGGCTGPSANDMYRAERYGYNPYYGNGPYYGYNGYGPAVVTTGSTGTCILLIICTGTSHKPRNGELRQLADGTTVSYDKATNRWLVVNRPGAQPRNVYSDRDVYYAQ